MSPVAWEALRVGICSVLVMASLPAMAQLQLAGVFGDHMVLQRDAPIRVWGRATPGGLVAVRLKKVGGPALGSQATRADSLGRWSLQLPALPAGGPLELQASADDKTVVVHDVLMGDLWLCAGQSNMEWTVAQSRDAAAEIASAQFEQIRHIKVAHRTSLHPLDNMPAAPWKRALPGEVGEFSGAGYFFARKVHGELGVPIGLINIAWGGTHLETWTSPRAARVDPDLAEVMQRFPADAPAFAAARDVRIAAAVRRWQPDWRPMDEAAALPAALRTDDSAWNTLQVPQIWEEQGLPGFDGVVWYRRRVELTAEQAAASATLHLGAIDDCDETYVNGQRVGGQCVWDAPRRYALPSGLLRAGSNLIAVRVLDTGGGGGFHGDAAAVKLSLSDSARTSFALAGAWRARVAFPLLKKEPGFNDLPTLVFNGMAQPLLPMQLRGVLWFQGESNVDRAARYAAAFQRLITDWRSLWAQPELPFLYVQLAAFLPLSTNSLRGSAWAELRDAQSQALSLPHTGMAVATDIGEAADIHPRNKQDVGLRLALLALRRVHGLPVVDSGPSLRDTYRVGSRMHLGFETQGAGLAVRAGEVNLQGFTVADDQRRFVPAKARIVDDHIEVWSDDVPQPTAVRYGWVNNPQQANLVNRLGLPASPFRTDRWLLLTRNGRHPFE